MILFVDRDDPFFGDGYVELQDGQVAAYHVSGYQARSIVVALFPGADVVRFGGDPERWAVSPDGKRIFPFAVSATLAWKLAAVFAMAFGMGGIPTESHVGKPRSYLRWGEFFAEGRDWDRLADQAIANIRMVNRERLIGSLPGIIGRAKGMAKLRSGNQTNMFDLLGDPS